MLDFMDNEHEEDKKQLQKEKELRKYAQAPKAIKTKLGDVIDLNDSLNKQIMKKNEFFDQFDKIVQVTIEQEANKSKTPKEITQSIQKEMVQKTHKSC